MDSLTEINNDTRFEHFIDESLDIDMSACTPIRNAGGTSYIDEILGMAAMPHGANGGAATVKPISPASVAGTQTHEFLVRLSPVARKFSPPKPPLAVATSIAPTTPIKTVRLFGQEQQTGNASTVATAPTAVTIKKEIFATDEQCRQDVGSHAFLVPSGRKAVATPTKVQLSTSFRANAAIAAGLPPLVTQSVVLVTAKKPLPIDFFCHQCDTLIKLHAEFETHYRVTHDTAPPIYACQLCPTKRFGNLQSYRTHVKRHSERHPCAVCTRKFLSAELLAEHGRTHTSELRLQCGQCQQQFDDFGVYCQHVRVHRRPAATKPVKWKCPDCGKLFKNRAGLNNHAKVHRDVMSAAAVPVTIVNDSAGASTSAGAATSASIAPSALSPAPTATLATKTSSVKRALPPNLSASSTMATNNAPPAASSAAVVALKPPAPVIANVDRPFVCDVCQKSFPGRTQLLRHRDHHNERSFECMTCSKFYKTERDLKVHSLVHYEQRPHACTHCGKSFLSSSKLKQHSNVHTGERPFKCKYCDKDFTNFPNWLKHVRRSHKVDHKTGEQLEQLPNFLVREKKGGGVRVKKEPKEPVAVLAGVSAANADDRTAVKPKPTPRKTKAQQQAAAAVAAAAAVQQKPTVPAAPKQTPAQSKLQQQPLLTIIKQEFIMPDDSALDLHDTNATPATSQGHMYQDEASLPLDLRDLSASIQLQQSIDVHDMQQMQLLIPSHDESFASIEDARDGILVRKSVSPAAASSTSSASVVGKVLLGKVAGVPATILTPKMIKVEPGRFSFARRPDVDATASSAASSVSFLTLLSQSANSSSDKSAHTTTASSSASGQAAAAAGHGNAASAGASKTSNKQLSPLSNVPRRHFGGVSSHSHHMFATNVL